MANIFLFFPMFFMVYKVVAFQTVENTVASNEAAH